MGGGDQRTRCLKLRMWWVDFSINNKIIYKMVGFSKYLCTSPVSIIEGHWVCFQSIENGKLNFFLQHWGLNSGPTG
jgi:hypothetical protein